MRTVTIHASTGRDAVLRACREVLEFGREVSPRGQRTLELSPVYIELRNPADTLPDGINRAKLQPAIAAAEALQNIAGVSMPGLMSRISAFFPKPTSRWDKGNETYGPRIGTQMDDAIGCLRGDPESREAVVAIWREGDIVGGQAHNLCTTTLHLMIRHGKLDLFVNMRSNDAWYGLCYDLFQFAQVQLTAARCLDVPVGRYFHAAHSLHLYEGHWEAASQLQAPAPDHAPLRLHGIGAADDRPHAWAEARARAYALLCGELLHGETTTEWWYRSVLAPFDPDGT